jgi:lambda repressor-like predicted transcriptional regulator
VATLIASAGSAGVSLDRLRRVVGLQPETLADVLKVLVATGQVVVLKVNGQLVYRAAG